MKLLRTLGRARPVGIRPSDQCSHEVMVTSVGGGIQRRLCRRCHAVSVERTGWTPTLARVRPRFPRS